MVSMFAAIFLFLNNSSNENQTDESVVVIDAAQLDNYKEIAIPAVQIKKHKDLMEIENLLYGDKGILHKLINELMEKGYSSHTLTLSYSPKDVQINIILLDRIATEKEQGILKSIFLEIIKENNLNPNIFTLKVSDEKDEKIRTGAPPK